MAVNRSEWKWWGTAGHFICGPWCRFHLCTEIGEYVVSTVGDFHSTTQIRAKGERTEAEDIGHNRKYETMVFRVTGHCNEPGCSCGHPMIDPTDLEIGVYNTAADAARGHSAMCDLIASREVK